jgi:hypothetical protein
MENRGLGSMPVKVHRLKVAMQKGLSEQSRNGGSLLA